MKRVGAILVVLLAATLSWAAEKQPAFVFRVDLPDAEQGQFAEARLRIVPSEGFRLNTERRVEVMVNSPEGVVVDSPSQLTVDGSEAQLTVRFKPKAAGEKLFVARTSFEVCDGAGCTRHEQRVAFAVFVR
jgi:hypothetical protein